MPLLKRGHGTFHNVSSKNLPLYVAVFEWRYNDRTHEDIFGAANNAVLRRKRRRILLRVVTLVSLS